MKSVYHYSWTGWVEFACMVLMVALLSLVLWKAELIHQEWVKYNSGVVVSADQCLYERHAGTHQVFGI